MIRLAAIALALALAGEGSALAACPKGSHRMTTPSGASYCVPDIARPTDQQADAPIRPPFIAAPSSPQSTPSRAAPPPPRPSSGGPTAGASRADVIGARPLLPVRAYLPAAAIPPAGVGAYGVFSLRAKATPATRARLLMACAAYKASLPPQAHAGVPVHDQMVTIWPLETPDAAEARADNCDFVIDHYDLVGGIQAIEDAQRQGAELGGDGPYLIGWSPPTSRGQHGQLVLVVNMSGFTTQDRFDHAFVFWQKKVVEDPKLWRTGFSVDELRLNIRDFVDTYGDDLLNAIKLAGNVR